MEILRVYGDSIGLANQCDLKTIALLDQLLSLVNVPEGLFKIPSSCSEVKIVVLAHECKSLIISFLFLLLKDSLLLQLLTLLLSELFSELSITRCGKGFRSLLLLYHNCLLDNSLPLVPFSLVGSPLLATWHQIFFVFFNKLILSLCGLLYVIELALSLLDREEFLRLIQLTRFQLLSSIRSRHEIDSEQANC